MNQQNDVSELAEWVIIFIELSVFGVLHGGWYKKSLVLYECNEIYEQEAVVWN